MPERTTSTGTTVRLTARRRDGDVLVILDNPASPADMRNTEAGRVIEGAFQPAPFSPFALTPETLRAIADVLDAPSDVQLADDELEDDRG